MCWAVLRAPAGRLLAPMLPVPLLRRDRELELTDEQAALLVRMSATIIDRKLVGERARLIPRGPSHTKPGTLLKSQIPVRTWAEWDDAVESDLVGHEGDTSFDGVPLPSGGPRRRARAARILQLARNPLDVVIADERERSEASSWKKLPSL